MIGWLWGGDGVYCFIGCDLISVDCDWFILWFILLNGVSVWVRFIRFYVDWGIRDWFILVCCWW